MNNNKKIAIIGAGITGLFSAYYLKKLDYSITVFDPAKDIGGLASGVDFAGTKLEKFFHHFFSADKELIDFLKEVNLDDHILWEESKVGFYYDHNFYPFDTAIDILKFRPLSLKNRLLLGSSFFYFKYKKNYLNLENRTVEEWYKRFGGQQIFDLVWKPLLISKFGKKYYKQIPVSWLWGRIHPRIKSRSDKKERLGYLSGSTQLLIDKIVEFVGKDNFIKEAAISIEEKNDRVEINTNKQFYNFDTVIVTTPLPLFVKIYKNITKAQKEEWKIKYQGVICVVLELTEPLSDYYWLNIIDSNVSFSGIIEHTNLVPSKLYDNSFIAYVFNYIGKGDELLLLSDDEIISKYINDLQKMFPRFRQSNIKSFVINRTNYATPVYEFGYSKIMPPYKVTNKIFLANTTQIYPFDRNINNSIKLVKNFLRQYEKEL